MKTRLEQFQDLAESPSPPSSTSTQDSNEFEIPAMYTNNQEIGGQKDSQQVSHILNLDFVNEKIKETFYNLKFEVREKFLHDMRGVYSVLITDINEYPNDPDNKWGFICEVYLPAPSALINEDPYPSDSEYSCADMNYNNQKTIQSEFAQKIGQATITNPETFEHLMRYIGVSFANNLPNCEITDHEVSTENSIVYTLKIAESTLQKLVLPNHKESKLAGAEAHIALVDDPVNAPLHYNWGKFETIDIIDDTVSDPTSYYHGNILKYVSRYRHKNGSQDLKKAQWYLERLIKETEHNENLQQQETESQ